MYKCSTLGTFTILEADTLAQNNVAIKQKEKHSGITEYDLNSVLHKAKPVLNKSSHAKFSQLVHNFLFLVFSKDEWDIGKCTLVHHKVQN